MGTAEYLYNGVGNMGPKSGTGVAFTTDGGTGQKLKRNI